MIYNIVSSSEWLYPDIFEYPTSKKILSCHAARGGYLTSQIQLIGVQDVNSVSCKIIGEAAEFVTEFYELVPVFVGESKLNTYDPKPMYPLRHGPFYLYDCIKPLKDSINVMNGTAGLYICASVSYDCLPGVYKGNLEIICGKEKIEIPVEFTVHKAVLPDESLKFINFYSRHCTAKYHNVKFDSDEHKNLDTQYYKMMRRMRQNMLYAGGNIDIKKNAENRYAFDFSKFEKFIKDSLSLGYKYFLAPYIGGRKSWKESTILVHGTDGGIPCLSYEAYAYLSQYLGEYYKVIEKNGWKDIIYFAVSDEPNEANAVEYRALCGMVRHLLPGIRLLDAMAYGPFFGSLDVYIPLNAEYEKHKEIFERFRSGGDELWHYVCCVPRGEGYINRFMDYPLLATRYLFWGNYKYNLKGYLHWAVNHYQPGQNPFTENWPSHTNADSQGILPPGDTHLIYPGEKEPWMSMRLEAHRESAEEYEMLKVLAEKNQNAADKICGKCFRGFNDVENDAVIFDSVRTELLEALGEVQE